MARRKENRTKKRIRPVIWVLLALVILGTVSGGVLAYLSASAGSASNELSVANHPTVTVDANNNITVTDPGYAVYLRAMVVVTWENTENDNVLMDLPVENTDYLLTLDSEWKKIGDFYYYTEKIDTTVTTNPIDALAAKTTRDGYALTATVVAQTVQAVGQTDGDTPVDAAQDAWGVTAAQITGS